MSRAKLQQIFVIWKIFFAIGICSGLRSKTAAIIRDVNSAKSLSCDPAYVIMRLYRGSSAVRLFDKQIRSAVTIKSQAFRNGRSHQRTKSRAMRNYGRLAERSKAAVLKTVDVQASGGSNPSPSASATSSGLKRYKKEHAPACSCFCIAYCLALRFAANSGIEMVTTHSVRLFRRHASPGSLRLPRLPPTLRAMARGDPKRELGTSAAPYFVSHPASPFAPLQHRASKL